MRSLAIIRRFIAISAFVVVVGALYGKDAESPYPSRIPSDHLPNLIAIHGRVISGGLPEGDVAFQELSRLGIKTIISVDGAIPDVATARKHGLRYVHLPHGYDGVPTQRASELAKAVLELDGPFYVHCHHGKHRSPVAASVACVTAGLIQPSQAIDILELAGTSRHYRGLYQSAQLARSVPRDTLRELVVDFREVVAVAPMAKRMVAIGKIHEHLEQIARSDWQTPSQHPDLDPAHEALLMREQFTELLRTANLEGHDERFKAMLKQSELDAESLHQALRKWDSAERLKSIPPTIPKLSRQITANCVACHAEFRDIPLGEK